MRTPSLSPFIGLLAAIVLVLSVITPAVAQDGSPAPELTPALETSPAPAAEPSPSPSLVEQLEERRAERVAEREERLLKRALAREVRAAKREIAKAERAAKRDAAKAERAAKREQRAARREARKAARAELRDAWKAAKEECRSALAEVRAQEWDDRSARREAMVAARTACRVALVSAATDTSAQAAAVDQLYTDASLAADGGGVVRTDLGLAEPTSAEGQQLGLWHYLIPAGAELAMHTHPGWQLARVTSGELEYTVVEGEGVLLRADGSSESMGPGTYLLATGDGVIENPELVHYGANRTDRPVTIISATLFEADEPISTLVEAAATE